MPKFIITVYGESEIIEVKDLDEAENAAYVSWFEQSDQDYSAEPYTPERARELEIEDEEEDDE